ISALNQSYRKLLEKTLKTDWNTRSTENRELRLRLQNCVAAIIQFHQVMKKDLDDSTVVDEILERCNHAILTRDYEELASGLLSEDSLPKQLEEHYSASHKGFETCSRKSPEYRKNTKALYMQKREEYIDDRRKKIKTANADAPDPVENTYFVIGPKNTLIKEDLDRLESFFNLAVCHFHLHLAHPIQAENPGFLELKDIFGYITFLTRRLLEIKDVLKKLDLEPELAPDSNMAPTLAQYADKIQEWIEILQHQLQYFNLGYSLVQPLIKEGYHLSAEREHYSTKTHHFSKDTIKPEDDDYAKIFKVSRKTAKGALLKKLGKPAPNSPIQKILQLAIKERLKDSRFIEYLAPLLDLNERKNLNKSQQSTQQEFDALAAKPLIMEAYIDFMMPDKKGAGEIAHLSIIQALAETYGVQLYCFKAGVGFNLLPADRSAHYVPAEVKSGTVYLLFSPSGELSVLKNDDTIIAKRREHLMAKLKHCAEIVGQTKQLQMNHDHTASVVILEKRLHQAGLLLKAAAHEQSCFISPLLLEQACEQVFSDLDELVADIKLQPSLTINPELTMTPA
ncbi:MAG: hypothetical protein ACHP9Y_03755, partial [Gammaproteobacteria bacterium]